MILVTGSAGYIGSQITKYFEINNIKYIGIDNFLHSTQKNIVNQKKFIKVDCKETTKIEKIINKFHIETVIHCAASSYVLEGEFKKKKYINNNYKNTKKFIDSCNKNSVKNFIFLSSSNVYSQSNKPYKENAKKKPKNTYGKTKLAIEKYLEKKKFDNLIVLRLFNIIGLIRNFYVPKKVNKNYQRLITNLFKQNKKENVVIRYKKINKKKILYPKRDFLDIRDFLKFLKKIIQLLKKNKNSKIILNVGSGNSISINHIIHLCKNKFNLNINPIYAHINVKEIMITKANIDKSIKKLKWKPKVSIFTSLLSYKKFLK